MSSASPFQASPSDAHGVEPRLAASTHQYPGPEGSQFPGADLGRRTGSRTRSRPQRDHAAGTGPCRVMLGKPLGVAEIGVRVLAAKGYRCRHGVHE